ncbi:cytochrome b-c1 complex subunit 9 [Lutzomyia longipalpis]|uniref:cytochrome b-c1 complex subunit 9 n=1 Tax=Lutzomyia longipalpis TaxID=7200 RepID=UPI00248369EB|nr:cytochrome b-c1 complex subunit 9 [Lutzomyia longipalpis]
MGFLYTSVFRRTSTFAVGVVASVFFFERAFDWGSDALFRSVNKGKLWDDIKHKYE